MVYAVIDTNVLVSALWTPARRVLDMLANRAINPYEVIAELNRPKFPFDAREGFIMEIGEDVARTSYDVKMPDDDRIFYEELYEPLEKVQNSRNF